MKDIQKKIRPAEGYLITSAANVQYLTHFTGTNGTVLLTKKKAFLITDARYARVAKKILPRNVELVIMASFKEEMPKLLKKLRTKNLNFESLDVSIEKHRQLKKLLKGIKLKASTTFIESFREVKTKEELKWIRESQRINEKTFQTVTKELKTGKSEKQVAWEIEKIGREMGADGISFDPIVAFGSNSGSPHHMNTTRKLKKGEMVLIDMGMKYKGYCSDMTRTLFTKKPTRKQENIYQIVLQSQKAAIQKLKAGIKGSAADKIARDIIEKAGFTAQFNHSLGHGIGLQVHESPSLSTQYRKPLPENTVVTVEPGIYLEKSFGVRIEDMVLIERHKAQNLTKIPTKIENLILSIS